MMHARLAQHITESLGRPPQNLDQVLPCFKEQVAQRNEHILRAGEVCRHVYYIAEGCLQVYVIDQQGKESIREFYFENQWVTDIFGFQNQTPSSEFIKCAEPCQLLKIHYDDFQVLSDRIPPFAHMYKQILELSYNNTVYRVNTLTSLNALDRIKWMMDNKPKLMSRISSKQVAAYLGITPETLTRYKARI